MKIRITIEMDIGSVAAAAVTGTIINIHISSSKNGR